MVKVKRTGDRQLCGVTDEFIQSSVNRRLAIVCLQQIQKVSFWTFRTHTRMCGARIFFESLRILFIYFINLILYARYKYEQRSEKSAFQDTFEKWK